LDARCGSGIWFGPDHPLNRAVRVPGPMQSNQIGEIAAVVVAMQLTDPTTPLTIVTDSRYTMDGLTKHLKHWEDNGWTNVANREWLDAAAFQLRRRAAPTNFKWVKGHQGTLGNEQADELANQGAQKNEPDQIDTTVPENFKANGIRLSTITQKTAYQAIKAKKNHPYTRQTLINLDITRYAMKDITGNTETDASLWKNIRHPDIRRPIQAFLYRALTGSLRIGDFWQKIPNYEQRAKCPNCEDQIENLEHILLECNNPERNKIWALLQRIWPDDDDTRLPRSLGQILGCGNISSPIQHDDPLQMVQLGINRLKRILVSETAHLIWVIRCERVIGGKRHPPSTIETRWTNKINARLEIDRRIAKSKRNIACTNKVKHTWSTVIPTDIHPNWITKLEVLVGINSTPALAITTGFTE
ncbi:ribonuclease H-like protein, partial [Boletus edulis]